MICGASPSALEVHGDVFVCEHHPTSIRHGGSVALVLDPIIDGFHLTRVLMDGGSNLNLLYQDTVRKMGIDPSRIKPTKTTEGVPD